MIELSPFASKIWELVPNPKIAYGPNSVAAILERLDWGLAAINRAHKFYFGPYSELMSNVFLDFGFDLLKKGLLRLPFDEAIFEYSGDKDDEKYDRHILLCRHVLPKDLSFRLKTEDISQDKLISVFCLHRRKEGRWIGASEVPLILSASQGFLLYAKVGDTGTNEVNTSDASVCVFSCAALASSVFVQKQVIIPTRLQLARSKNGKPPLYEFKIVEMRIEDTIRTPSIGSHASPALHWRRGHYRRLPGGIVPVSPCLVGDARNGIIDKDYDAKNILQGITA
jgi:hypothetical protein